MNIHRDANGRFKMTITDTDILLEDLQVTFNINRGACRILRDVNKIYSTKNIILDDMNIDRDARRIEMTITHTGILVEDL